MCYFKLTKETVPASKLRVYQVGLYLKEWTVFNALLLLFNRCYRPVDKELMYAAKCYKLQCTVLLFYVGRYLAAPETASEEPRPSNYVAANVLVKRVDSSAQA
jgi:hypothetical protein